jgi:hypothetical protein
MKFLSLKKYEESNKIFWKNDWMSFYPGFHKLNFTVAPAGYFDNRAKINFSLGWGQFYIDIPFIKSNLDESDPPRYGFYFYSTYCWFPVSFVWCWGRKVYFFEMPWSLQWVRTSILLKGDTWVDETKQNTIFFCKISWDSLKWTARYPYTNTKENGDIQFTYAKVTLEEREWRPKWFKWTTLFSKVKRSIDVTFEREIGEGEGTYKGGVTGCGYDMIPNETPIQCLMRMQEQRKF